MHTSSRSLPQSSFFLFQMLAAFGLLFGPSQVLAQGTTQVIGTPGMTIPGIPGTVDPYLCMINEDGRVLFFVPDYAVEWNEGQYLPIPMDVIPADTFRFPLGYSKDRIALWTDDFAGGLNYRAFLWDRLNGAWSEPMPPGTPDPDGDGETDKVWTPHMHPSGQWMLLEKLRNTSSLELDVRLWVTDQNGDLYPFIRESDPLPGGDIVDYFGFYADDYSVNAHGHVSFPATLVDTEDYVIGIYRWDGSTVQKVIRHGDALPGGGNTFIEGYANFGPGVRANINDHGHIAMTVKVDGSVDRVALLWDGFSLNEVLRTPTTRNGIVMDQIRSAILFNNAGDMAFLTSASDDPLVNSPGSLILLKNGDLHRIHHVDEIDEQGDRLWLIKGYADGNYNYPLPHAQINEHGVVAWFADVVPGGLKIYLSDGTERIRVPSPDNTNYRVWNFVPQGAHFLNDFGQVAYWVEDGNVELFTPDLMWRSGSSGNWDDKDNWILGLPPGRVHNVVIQSDFDVTVTGPAVPVSVKNLTVGDGSTVRNELRLQASPGRQSGSNTLTAVQGSEFLAGGVLSGSGSLAGNVNVFGEISPGNSTTGQLNFEGQVTFQPSSQTKIDLDGSSKAQFDQLNFNDMVLLGGTFELTVSDPASLSAGQEYLVGNTQLDFQQPFSNVPEGGVVYQDSGLLVFASYKGGDGNDFALMVTEAPVAFYPVGRKLLDGQEADGSLEDTNQSNNDYYSLNPSPTNNPAKQIVEMILLAEAPSASPSSMSFRVEASMSGGPQGDVIQMVELWNESEQVWETLDTRSATNDDSVVHIVPGGDVQRFVHPLTDEVIAKVKWTSSEFSGATFDWAIKIDHLEFRVGD